MSFTLPCSSTWFATAAQGDEDEREQGREEAPYSQEEGRVVEVSKRHRGKEEHAGSTLPERKTEYDHSQQPDGPQTAASLLPEARVSFTRSPAPFSFLSLVTCSYTFQCFLVALSGFPLEHSLPEQGLGLSHEF